MCFLNNWAVHFLIFQRNEIHFSIKVVFDFKNSNNCFRFILSWCNIFVCNHHPNIPQPIVLRIGVLNCILLLFSLKTTRVVEAQVTILHIFLRHREFDLFTFVDVHEIENVEKKIIWKPKKSYAHFSSNYYQTIYHDYFLF